MFPLKELFALEDPFILLLGLLNLKTCRNQVFVHDPFKSACDTFHGFPTVTIAQFVLVENVVGGLGPSVVQNGLDLNFTTQASESRIFGKAYAILTKSDRCSELRGIGPLCCPGWDGGF